MFRDWRVILLGATAALTAAGCGDEDAGPAGPQSGTFYGQPVNVGNGTARGWVTLDAGQPTAVGVSLTATALVGLPASSTEYTVSLPAQAAATAFDHVGLDWNPAGHPPPDVYTVPHFDFHFYRITEAERAAILATPADSANVYRTPAPQNVPAGYIDAHAGEPRMGNHWIDPTSSEFQPGGTFTKTFIYGFYNGQLVFWEPMITLAHLQSNPDATATLKLPQQYPQANEYYPTTYSVTYDAGTQEYRIVLGSLVLRP